MSDAPEKLISQLDCSSDAAPEHLFAVLRATAHDIAFGGSGAIQIE